MHRNNRIENFTPLKLTLLTKACLSELLKFPCYSHDDLDRQLSGLVQQCILESDIQAYAKCSTKIPLKRWRSVLTAITILYIMKNLSILYLTLGTIDSDDSWMSINSELDLEQDNSTYIFSLCFYSNCTEYSRPYTGAAKDVRYFPAIPICHPEISFLYPPTIWIPPQSFMLHLMTAVVCFVVNILLHLYTYRRPTPCDALMFLQAPILTSQILEMKAMNIYASLKRSYRAFSRRNRNIDDSDLVELDKLATSFGPSKRQEGYIAATDAYDKHDLDQWYRHKSDCLPRIRTDNWRIKGSQIFIHAMVGFSFMCLAVFVYITYDIYRRCLKKYNEHNMYRDEIIRSRCKQIRVSIDGTQQFMNPDEWLFRWNFLSLLDNSITFTVMIVVATILSTYYLIVAELNDWRLELVEQYDILSEATWVLIYEIGSGGSIGYGEPKRAQLIDCRKMSMLKLLDIAELHFKRIKDMVPASGSRFSLIKLDTIFSESRAFPISQNPDPYGTQGFERYIALMEKFYVSFRLFHWYVKRCAASTTPLTIISHVLSYSLIGVAVWHSRMVGQFLVEHTVLIGVNCCFTLSPIVIMSNFHAKVS